uniref:Structure-specific endonuclease subunit SLX1 homolog n=1 Tax=Anthurium amnicola TaxID=1678845 RepID=A0A1D1XJG7_9ARAE
MRRAKQRAENFAPELVREEFEEENVDEKNGFFACYLLCSLCPRYKGHTYIGFTINPRRRIRQHNGEIRCGAWRTKCKRPWEMVLCIHGFPSQVSALQFEWAWQHPKESLAVRKAAATFRSLSGIENKIRLAYAMLTLPQWESLNITVNYFSTKYMRHSAHCPRLPKHMRVRVHAMDELPCYLANNILDDDDDDNDKDDVDDAHVGISTSVNNPFANRSQMDTESCDSLLGERESNDCRLQKMIHGIMKPSKPIEEEDGTTLSSNRSVGMAHSDDLFAQEEDDHKQLVDPFEASCLTASPMHSYKENLAASDGCLFPFSNDLTTQLKQLSTPLSLNYGVSCGNTPLSPKCDIIDLSTPSSCIAHTGMKQSSISVEIIDLIDSPI